MHDSGAYTGEIPGGFLKALGCSYVIIGHSERRQYHGETDEIVGNKVKAALKHGVVPVLCVGETEAELEEFDALPYKAPKCEEVSFSIPFGFQLVSQTMCSRILTPSSDSILDRMFSLASF